MNRFACSFEYIKTLQHIRFVDKFVSFCAFSASSSKTQKNKTEHRHRCCAAVVSANHSICRMCVEMRLFSDTIGSMQSLGFATPFRIDCEHTATRRTNKREKKIDSICCVVRSHKQKSDSVSFRLLCCSVFSSLAHSCMYVCVRSLRSTFSFDFVECDQSRKCELRAFNLSPATISNWKLVRLHSSQTEKAAPKKKQNHSQWNLLLLSLELVLGFRQMSCKWQRRKRWPQNVN